MAMTYQALFELTFEHDYFNEENGPPFLKFGARILNISPGVLYVKERNNKVIVYGTSKEDFTNLPSLCFSIDFLDPNFFNYTDITINPPNLLYLSNDIASGNDISATTAQLLPNFAKRFVYPLEPAQQQLLSQVQGGLVASQKTDATWPHVPQQNGCYIDLEGEPAGAYQAHFSFTNAQLNQPAVFFVSNEFFQRPPAAVFEWRNTISVNSTTKYTLTFKSRATYWRYYLLGISPEEWQDAAIKPIEVNGQSVEFLKEDQAQKLPGGQEAFVFFSNQPIPLQQRPAWKLALYTKQFPEGIALPYAAPNNLRVLNAEERAKVQSSLTNNLQGEGLSGRPVTAYCSDIFCNV